MEVSRVETLTKHEKCSEIKLQGDFFQSKSGTGVLQSLIWD